MFKLEKVTIDGKDYTATRNRDEYFVTINNKLYALVEESVFLEDLSDFDIMSLSDFVNLVSSWAELAGDDAIENTIHISALYSYSYTDWLLSWYRLETEEERESRLDKARKNRKLRKQKAEEKLAKERELYEKLKAKFENEV